MAVLYTPRLDNAIRVAARAHSNQMRKGSDTPFIVHPFGVMTIAATVTDDEDTLIACLFHDIIEDVPDEYSEAQMRQEFGDHVADIVRGVTHDGTINDWRERCEAYLYHLRQASDESVIVSGADKIQNLTTTLMDYEVQGDELWQIFKTKSGNDQLWWYESVLEVLRGQEAPEALSSQLAELVGKLRPLVGTELRK